MTTYRIDTVDLPEQARLIAERLRANGFPAEGAVQRNVLCLAEEAGELVGAYRRWTGQARRTGTAQQMYAELADVVITAYVLAHELHLDLDAAIAAKLDVIFARGWHEQPTFECPAPRICPCHGDADEHAVFAWHRTHDGTGRDDCPYCPTVAEIAQWEAEQQAAQEGDAA